MADRNNEKRVSARRRLSKVGKVPPAVAIVMGSISDHEVMRDAEQVLNDFGISFSVEVVSAHRTPARMYDFAREAHLLGVRVIIAGAGGAAHLPGMVASLTPLPVIGVPVSTKKLDGLDSLLSIVQMPKGIPVATVAINNSANAALLAARILGVDSPKDQKMTLRYQADLEKQVRKMNENFLKSEKFATNSSKSSRKRS